MNYDPTSINSWLSFDEGRKLKQYPDSKGIPTIGIGNNLIERPIDWLVGDRDLVNVGITDAECDTIFEKTISEIMGCLRCKLTWFDDLDVVRQNVLLNIAFNIGCEGLMKFVHMLAFASQGMWANAAAEILDSDAAKELPNRYQRLSQAMLNG